MAQRVAELVASRLAYDLRRNGIAPLLHDGLDMVDCGDSRPVRGLCGVQSLPVPARALSHRVCSHVMDRRAASQWVLQHAARERAPPLRGRRESASESGARISCNLTALRGTER